MHKKFFPKIGIVLLITCLAVIVYHCKNPKKESAYYSPEVLATHSNGERYVGSEACMECHAGIYDDHLKTAHYNSSAMASSKNILGSFEKGSNILDLDHVKFTMKQKGDSLYQYTELKNRNAKKPSSVFDIVIGSGVRGQSYATWKDNELFQLQTSYHTPTDSWVNSPGFPNFAGKDRPVRGACLKCHVTFAKPIEFSKQGNGYEKKKMIYGIDCEKCHRPSEKHVVYHRQNPNATKAKFMLPLDSLSRMRRSDVCAQCHSGSRDRVLKGNSFSFLSGEVLDEYMQNSYQSSSKDRLDVHGNQYGLLTESECFKQSGKMDCTTCHNPHKNQRGDTAYFNQKCMECHSTGNTTCPKEKSAMNTNSNNCIACHMPISASEAMKVQLNKTDSLETSFYIRSHLIGIYENE